MAEVSPTDCDNTKGEHFITFLRYARDLPDDLKRAKYLIRGTGTSYFKLVLCGATVLSYYSDMGFDVNFALEYLLGDEEDGDRHVIWGSVSFGIFGAFLVASMLFYDAERPGRAHPLVVYSIVADAYHAARTGKPPSLENQRTREAEHDAIEAEGLFEAPMQLMLQVYVLIYLWSTKGSPTLTHYLSICTSVISMAAANAKTFDYPYVYVDASNMPPPSTRREIMNAALLNPFQMAPYASLRFFQLTYRLMSVALLPIVLGPEAGVVVALIFIAVRVWIFHRTPMVQQFEVVTSPWLRTYVPSWLWSFPSVWSIVGSLFSDAFFGDAHYHWRQREQSSTAAASTTYHPRPCVLLDAPTGDTTTTGGDEIVPDATTGEVEISPDTTTSGGGEISPDATTGGGELSPENTTTGGEEEEDIVVELGTYQCSVDADVELGKPAQPVRLQEQPRRGANLVATVIVAAPSSPSRGIIYDDKLISDEIMRLNLGMLWFAFECTFCFAFSVLAAEVRGLGDFDLELYIIGWMSLIGGIAMFLRGVLQWCLFFAPVINTANVPTDAAVASRRIFAVFFLLAFCCMGLSVYTGLSGDECFKIYCGIGGACKPLDGTYECICGANYEKLDGGTRMRTKCVDTDECERNTDDCAAATHYCENTVGSFDCVICPTGYTTDPDGLACTTDIDECATDTHECDPGTCASNTIGSYTCACDVAGYELSGDGRTCNDIDECERNTDDCAAATHYCDNTVGSFDCVICPTGYTTDADGLACTTDIDECATDTHECDPGTCASNTIGSYTCACDIAGYELSGDGRTCDDIDECDTATHECDPGTCASNTIGSYTCACDVAGYELSGDGRNCVGVCDSGVLLAEQKISSATQGGLLVDPLDNGDRFGSSVAAADFDRDGVMDLVVGAPNDGDGGILRGAVYVLLLNPDHTVKAQGKISSTAEGGLDPLLDNGDRFGSSVAAADFDDDGVMDLVVGAPWDDGEILQEGAVYVLLLNTADQTVKAQQKISSTHGGLVGPLDAEDEFGSSVAAAHFDDDGVMDLVVGAYADFDGGNYRGAVYVLLLNPDQTVKAEQKISSTRGGLVGPLQDYDYFGSSVAAADFDSDGVMDLVVGARWDYGDNKRDRGGAVYVLLLNPNQTVVMAEQKISSTQGGLVGPLDNEDSFGFSVAAADFDSDGVMDLVVGAPYDDDGGDDRGAVYVLLLNTHHTVKAEQKISSTQGGGGGQLVVRPVYDSDLFGSSVAAVGDLDGDGVVVDLVVGAPEDDGGGTDRGAVYVLEVPQGFAPVCAPDEACVNTGNNTYLCEQQ